MFIILGSGLNGLLLAQRCRLLRIPFVMVGEGLLASGNRKGFFYAHEPNPFTEPKPYPITSGACPGGSTEKYCQKVYGLIPQAQVSYGKYAAGGVVGEGWSYDEAKLVEGIQEGRNYFEDRVIEIDPQRALFTLRGRTWPLRNRVLLNTIPLPNLIKLLGNRDEYAGFEDEEIFHSKPIYIREFSGGESTLPLEMSAQGIHVRYCASDCHPWYRGTTFNKGEFFRVFEEHSEPPSESHITLYPGKIWSESELESQEIQDLVEDLWNRERIYCYGRYATWTPKGLSSQVWNDSTRLEFMHR